MHRTIVLYLMLSSLTRDVHNSHPPRVTSAFGLAPLSRVGVHRSNFGSQRREQDNSCWYSTVGITPHRLCLIQLEASKGSNNGDESSSSGELSEKRLGSRPFRGRRFKSTKSDNDPEDGKKNSLPRAKMKKLTSSSFSTLLPPPSIGSGSGGGRRWATTSSQRKSRGSGGQRRMRSESNGNVSERKQSFKQSSLSSTLHGGDAKLKKSDVASPPPFTSTSNEKAGSSSYSDSISGKSSWDSVFDYLPPPSSNTIWTENGDLPEWGALFVNPSSQTVPYASGTPFVPPTVFPTPSIDGVLPVSELFYRSTQSISTDDDGEEESTPPTRQGKSQKSRDDQKQPDNALGDDEELPFSAEQSDRLSIPGNKIQIRRNKANGSTMILDEIGIGIEGDEPSEAVQKELSTMAKQERDEQRRLSIRRNQSTSLGDVVPNGDRQRRKIVEPATKRESPVADGSLKSTKPRVKKKGRSRGDRASGRKMVRRGMEMLVGGEPINADPPQRAVELNYYRKHPKLWARSITTNSPDFGPLLHMHSAGKVGRGEIGLFCENFVGTAQKWNICPDDLKTVVSKHELRKRNSEAAADHAAAVGARGQRGATTSNSDDDVESRMQTAMAEFDKKSETKSSLSGFEVDIEEGIISDAAGKTIMFNPREFKAPKGFGASPKQSKKKTRDSRGGGSGMASDRSLSPVHKLGGESSGDNELSQNGEADNDDRLLFTLGGELKFSLGVTRAELESGPEHGKAFRRVLRDGIGSSINALEMGFEVHIAKLVIADVEGGSTDVVVQFQLDPKDAMDIGEAERAAKEVNGALASAMDDGKMAMALAHVAREEKGWPSKIRDRIVEEFLFETEDDDEDKEFDAEEEDADGDSEPEDGEDEEYDGPFGMEGDLLYEKDDLWLGGGNGGVFFDYSESNAMNSPYKGELGPYLVDAAVERAKQNQPRVIAIGDVHGCIDELQALLRKCDYHPGDLVVFLGDLVCKGPDSLSVVQMAREIGAIGIRGNHDFEVVRWHQAIKSGTFVSRFLAICRVTFCIAYSPRCCRFHRCRSSSHWVRALLRCFSIEYCRPQMDVQFAMVH